MISIIALYGGWMWMRASNELIGRPFWVVGIGSLSISSALLGSTQGSIGWGVSLILVGGLIFSYSARDRRNLLIIFLGILGLSSIPFSATAYSWPSNYGPVWFSLLLLIPAQAMVMVGLIRHALQPGEISLESQYGWVKILYSAGLLVLVGFLFLFGILAWFEEQILGSWWAAIPVGLLITILLFINIRLLGNSSRNVSQWGDAIPTKWIYRTEKMVSDILERITITITTTLEGEGGLFWSFLLLVLILSLLYTGTP
jgi:hypothetical protein